MKKLTINDLREQGLIIYEVIAGSHLFGLNTETSDEDFRGVYVQPEEMILTGNYIEQVDDEKGDTTFYELNKFLEMLKECKPNAVEILFAPKNCIKIKKPCFSLIMDRRDEFLNEKYVESSIKFAESQIRKAQGLNKKLNWERDRVTRKNVLDFCYVPHKQGSKNVVKFLESDGLKQEYCGLVALKNMRYTYGVYYDFWQHVQFENLNKVDAITLQHHLETMFGYDYVNLNEYEERVENYKNLKYKGIVQDVETSNDISLSQVPKDHLPLITMVFNKDGYSKHCTDYREYQKYLKDRNTSRYTDFQKHGQSYDGKNLLHMMRSLKICLEYTVLGEINLDRRGIDRDYLLSIKRGEVDLKEILDYGQNRIDELRDLEVTETKKITNEEVESINLRIRGMVKKENFILKSVKKFLSLLR